MNLSEILKQVLSKTGLPVCQDEYSGHHDKYIIFTYEDERPVYHANNRVIADTTYLKIQLITPKNFDYFSIENEIRTLLEGADFSVTSIRSFLGSAYMGTSKIRQTIFQVEHTIGRRRNNG